MDLIPVPAYYLAIRYIQAPLAALVFVLDIATIGLVSTNGNYTYGSLGWCAVVSFFTIVVCSVHISRIRVNSGFTNGITILVFEVISKIVWLTVWSVMAWSAADVQATQLGGNWQGILGCTALAATAAAIQWVLFTVTLITFIICWIRSNRNKSASTPAPATTITVTPDKMEQGIQMENQPQYQIPPQQVPTQGYPHQYPAQPYPTQAAPYV